MPSLGADMKSGKLLAWKVRPGDRVRRGDIVATVDTSKAEIDVEIFEEGVVDALLVEPGEEVAVGTALATVRATEAQEPAAPAAPPVAAPAAPAVAAPAGPAVVAAPAVAAPAGPAVVAAPPVAAPAGPAVVAAPPVAAPAGPAVVAAPPVAAPAGPAVVAAPPVAAPAAPPVAVSSPAVPVAPRRPVPARVLASPFARRTALRLGIALDRVAGSGPGGAVLAADLSHAAPAPDRATSMRQAISAAMARSKREIPHYYLAATIDMTVALEWLAAHNAALPMRERLLSAVLTLKAAALAAREVPALNGHWIDGAHRAGGPVHAGVAVSLRQGGLIAPAIHDADSKPLDQLMRDLHDLVQRVRSGGLRSSEMTDATITISSLGDRGADTVFGVIYPPQVALVGFGAIAERPVVHDGEVVARPTVCATLAADHRASDGSEGSVFLAAVDRFLQAPEQL
jgi:pyruvate dehydrogenase E2 component (dihydrolipoamide acetyltransferase)